MEAFFTLHSNIPREGPGSDEATREAIRRLPPLPPAPRILDLGCGPGKQTLVLARHFRTLITAVDLHAPYLDRLCQSAAAEGLADVVETRLGRMEELQEPPGSVDLIWIEGAIYMVGFAAGLRLWRQLLRDGGLVVASEATWFTDAPPADVRSFWREEYPAMTTVDGNIKRAAECGFEVLDHFALPTSAWWDEYYTPLSERMAQLRQAAMADSDLANVLDETEREMAMHERHSDSYGYVFYLMQKTN
ncbi:MAG: class I SAM-dependent methyltransferase [Phycisphaerales bacterium]|jgi:serine/threonine-protein kinase HipA|nr:class I SAM-dependent methyltransferase [Phycisphaerales bacterium]